MSDQNVPDQFESNQIALTLNDIYIMLMEKEDITIEVASEWLHRIRKGVSTIKAKNNAKLKAAGLPTDGSRVEYKIIESNLYNETVKLKIWLVKPEAIPIHGIVISSSDLA